MKISCPSCAAAYELDEARVSPSGLNIKCPKCKKPFTVHRPKADASKAGAKPAVPLPGQPGAKAPASKPAGVKPVKPGAAGAVPLPGMDDAPAADGSPPLPDLEAPGAVALPGLDGGAALRKPPEARPPSAPRTPGATADPVIPLPGFDDPAPPGASPPEPRRRHRRGLHLRRLPLLRLLRPTIRSPSWRIQGRRRGGRPPARKR